MAFFFQMNTVRVILKNALALPSFIMALNGCFCFEVHKSASIHHKVHLPIIKVLHMALGVNKGLLKRSNELV